MPSAAAATGGASSARGAAAPSTCRSRSPAARRSRDACSPRRRAARRSARAVGRQVLERRLEIHREVPGAGQRRQRLEDLLAVEMPLPAHGLGPEAFDHDVDREPMQPGAERRVAAKAGELLPDAHEDVLRQLVGVPRPRSSGARGRAPGAGARDRAARRRARLPPRPAPRHRWTRSGGRRSAACEPASVWLPCAKLLSGTGLDGCVGAKGWKV